MMAGAFGALGTRRHRLGHGAGRALRRWRRAPSIVADLCSSVFICGEKTLRSGIAVRRRGGGLPGHLRVELSATGHTLSPSCRRRSAPTTFPATSTVSRGCRPASARRDWVTAPLLGRSFPRTAVGRVRGCGGDVRGLPFQRPLSRGAWESRCRWPRPYPDAVERGICRP